MHCYDMAYRSKPEEPSSNPPSEDGYGEYLTSGVQPQPGLALHKLCSNDGWIVTVEERRRALNQ